MRVPHTYFPDEGDWCWLPNESAPDRICVGLPRVGAVRLRIVNGPAPANDQVWGWNGDLEAPTLDPSIDCDGGDAKWHGWLRDGVLIEQGADGKVTP